MGAGLALLACGALLAWVGGPPLGLIAPMGATAFLLFAVPNSPLAQPWSAAVGNGAAALVGVTVVGLGLPMPVGAGLAVCGALAAMALLRAMHPPGGAVALAAVLSASTVAEVGYRFVLAPVLLDTVLLVGLAVVLNRLTGRRYPFRQPVLPDRVREDRLGLSYGDLEEVLRRLNQSVNIGTEDFARLLVAAEAEAERQRAARARGTSRRRVLVMPFPTRRR